MPRPRLVATALLVAVVAGGCSLAARRHPCWAFLQHRYQGHLPSDFVRALARECGAVREIGRWRAPTGYYWRRERPASLDLRDVRTINDGHELAPCPAPGLSGR
jgi:hypothetical protein